MHARSPDGAVDQHWGYCRDPGGWTSGQRRGRSRRPETMRPRVGGLMAPTLPYVAPGAPGSSGRSGGGAGVEGAHGRSSARLGDGISERQIGHGYDQGTWGRGGPRGGWERGEGRGGRRAQMAFESGGRWEGADDGGL